MSWVYDRYYKEKMIYEDNSKGLEIIQSEFFGGKLEMYSLLWGLSLGVGLL